VTHTEVRLVEFGPVTFPAYEATSAGVRGVAAYQAWEHQRARQDTTTIFTTTDSNSTAGTTTELVTVSPGAAVEALGRAEREKTALSMRHAINLLREGQS
jgi:hypothetical protein